jgi:hypothetical protein
MSVIHFDEADPGTQAQWHKLSLETTVAMQNHCLRYITPISFATTNEEGRLQGTGAYIEFGGQRLLISNEHVIKPWKRLRLGRQFLGCTDVFGIGKPLALEGHPIDAAICPISEAAWNARPHAAEPVPWSRFATKHAPVSGEMLFLCGYPGARSKFVFGSLVSYATQLVTQEPPDVVVPGLHQNYFILGYSPGKAWSVDPSNPLPLSLPPGLSGSLVWNTRRVECLQRGDEWSPEKAQVTGLLCSWIEKPTPYVVATRIEVIRKFLRRRTRRPHWVGWVGAALRRFIRKTFRLERRKRSSKAGADARDAFAARLRAPDRSVLESHRAPSEFLKSTALGQSQAEIKCKGISTGR